MAARNHSTAYQQRNAKAVSEGFDSYNVKRRYLSELSKAGGLDSEGKAALRDSSPRAIRDYVEHMTPYGRKRIHASLLRRWRIDNNDFTDWLDDHPEIDFDWKDWRDSYSTT